MTPRGRLSYIETPVVHHGRPKLRRLNCPRPIRRYHWREWKRLCLSCILWTFNNEIVAHDTPIPVESICKYVIELHAFGPNGIATQVYWLVPSTTVY